MCAEQIPADAVFCPYCGTRFGEQVQVTPPPAASTSSPASPSNVQPAHPASPSARISHTGLWIAGTFGVVIILGLLGILLWNQRTNATLRSGVPTSPVPTNTPIPTITPTSPPTPTRTPRPTATATPLPEWVTGFAQPILDAIANRAPNFQDDFGLDSTSWQAPDWCGRRMEYVEGEMVVTDCRLHRPNINYSDFLIEFDGRFFELAASDSVWSLSFRQIEGPNHSARFHYNGDVTLSFYEGGYYEFPNAANSGNHTNHIIIIGKSSRFAIFLNNEPLFGINVPSLKFGDFEFLADGTVLAIDNIRIWNIGDITIP